MSFQRESDVKNTKWGSFRKEFGRPCEKASSRNSPAIKLSKSLKSWYSLHFSPLFSFFFISHSLSSPISFLFLKPSSLILYTPSPFFFSTSSFYIICLLNFHSKQNFSSIPSFWQRILQIFPQKIILHSGNSNVLN